MNTSIANASNNTLSPRPVVEAFFRRKQLFLWTVLIVFLAALSITLLKHKQFSSEMKFIVLNTRGNVVLTPERTTTSNAASDVTETQVNSELEILHSHDVVDPVADPDWARLTEAQHTPEAVRRHEKLVVAFDRRLSTEIIRKTNIIVARVTANSPEKAQSDLEHLSTAYLAEHRRLQRPAGESAFFKAEAERARKEWDSASQKLVEFQRQHQIVSIQERETTLNEQVANHERDILATDAALRELDAQITASEMRLRDLPMRETTVERTVPNQSSAEHLNTLLVELENKRTALLTKFKPTDRFVAELDQQIETTKAALKDAKTSTAREKSTDIDPAWQQLHTKYVEAEINRRQKGVHRASATAEVAALRQELGQTQELTVQFNNLESQASQAKQNFDLYAQKRDAALVEDAMDEQKLLNVAVAERPTKSYQAIAPKPVQSAVLGVVTSLFFAVCLVYLAEGARNSVATPRELDAASRYPVLATIPQLSLWDGSILRGLPGTWRTLPTLPSSPTTRPASSLPTLQNPNLGPN
jgi:uncharacterized protein involved in exopolysaccharide biosynthesis